MNKKVFSVLILTMFLMTIFSSVVVAQTGDIGEDMFGDKGIVSNLVSKFFDFINMLMEKQFTLPATGTKTNALGLIITFLVLFALVYPAASKIPVFKDETSKGMRKTFSIAIALAITLFSPTAGLVTGVMTGYAASLISIALACGLVVLFWFMIKGTQKGLASANKLGGEAAKISNETRKVKRDIQMEEAMDGRENQALTQLDGVDRNALAVAGNILATWRNIQRELASMGALRTEQAIQRGQQILSQIANVMGEESRESQIQAQMERITETLSRETIQDIATLTNDTKLQNDVINAMPGITTPVAARTFISRALANAKEAERTMKRIETMNAQNLKYQSEVRRLSNDVGNLIRNAKFKEAGSQIGTIIAEVQKEIANEQQIKQLINRVIQLVQNEVTQLHQARR